ncbi:hypothetical protein VN97_g12518, partial [Penicillium thymicola]
MPRRANMRCRGAVCQELAPSKILLSPALASHSEEIGESIWTDPLYNIIQFRFSSDSVQIQFRFSSDSVQI